MKGYMNNTPKSLLLIKKQSLIYRIINILKLYGIRNIYITVGYKKEKIMQHLKKIKDIKIQYIFVKNFKKTGSSYSWYLFKKKWLKKKQSVIMLHSDIYFDEKYIDKIVKSKRKNIIGSIKKKSLYIKKNGFIIKVDKKSKILKIGHKKHFEKELSYQEILCINKFSINTMKNILTYMRTYFQIYGKTHTWEYILNNFISEKKYKLFTIKSLNYFWHNINTPKEYNLAKKNIN